MIEIKSRYMGDTIYSSETATTTAQAVVEAVRSDANLYDAILTGANLTGANLTGANLTGANLTEAGVSELRGVLAASEVHK